ncbi:MAG: hypothetical protein WAZ12_03345 [Candidatus Absconditicoccaceae bacterium]
MKKSKLLFFFIIAIISFFCITNISKSDNTMVGYSDSKFLYGGNEIDTVNFEISGGVQTGFAIKIYNKENISMTYSLGSVDAQRTSDVLDKKTCLSEDEISQFGQYISGDKSSKTIVAGGSGIWNLTAEFPNYYSGIFNGCITFYPSIVGGTTVNTLPRRGNFINVTVHSVGKSIIIKAFPSNRINQSNNNLNSGTIKIYNTNKILQRTTEIGLNNNGTGILFSDIAPGTYYVVFKGQSNLASYLSGVIISGGNQTLDFTTGSNLYGSQQLNLSQDDGYRYQTAGDLKADDGAYDYFINGNDISIITAMGLIDNGIAVLDQRNLNGDTAINASDIAVIGINFEKTDPYFNNTFTR